MEARGVEHVEGILEICEEVAPKMEGEKRVQGAQSGDEMALEGVNCFFCWVRAVVVGRYQL